MSPQPKPETVQTARAILAAAIPDAAERAAVLAKLEAPAGKEKWLSTTRAAALAKCHRKTLFRWAAKGLLHPQRLTPSRVRWPRSELESMTLDADLQEA